MFCLSVFGFFWANSSDINIEAPLHSPTNKNKRILKIGVAAPTAAKALLSMNLPITIPSIVE